jgi:hypothetical protein
MLLPLDYTEHDAGQEGTAHMLRQKGLPNFVTRAIFSVSHINHLLSRAADIVIFLGSSPSISIFMCASCRTGILSSFMLNEDQGFSLGTLCAKRMEDRKMAAEK